MKQVLFIGSHRPDRAPGQRFRFEQYFQFLEENGFACHLSYLLNEEDDKLLYSKGMYFRKALMLWSHYEKRWRDLRHANDYDIIFIFREALMTRSLFFEKQLAKSKAKIIFDFDDAIWNNDTSQANQLFAWMKRPSKIATTIRLADMVLAGNSYLAEYARQYHNRVAIVPTTIDTQEYVSVERMQKHHVTIGWSGSVTTIKHFSMSLPFLIEVKRKYGERVRFKVIGDASYRNQELGIEGIAWSRENEVQELAEIDIGLMPLPDDEWSRGKCGLKGLQYMALGIPTLMSPVGVNTQIIQHGINGFLCGKKDDWIDCIGQLIETVELRTSMGREAIKTVEERFSVNAWSAKYLTLFNQLLDD